MKPIKHIVISMILIVLVLCSSIPAYAADLPPSLSDKQLEQTIDAYVEEHKDTTAAVSIGIFTKDSVLFEKSYGYAYIEENVPNDADTVIEWGSSSKLLVWVSVMQLVEQGKLDLNADIRTYLPEGFLKKLRYDDKITLTHLMNHTGGWQESVMGLFAASSDEILTLENAIKVLEPAQVFRPGEAVAYSNFGASLAGYIVERISGKPFYEYVHNNIFLPLGMEHTALKADWSDNPWVQNQRQKLYCYDINNNPIGKADFHIQSYSAGAGVGTISDYVTFGQALLPDSRGGTVLFNKPETLAQFYEPTNYYPDGTPRNRHGMLASPILKGNVAGHAGHTIGCSSNLLIDLDNGFGMVVMTNQDHELHYNKGLFEEIFGTIELGTDGSYPDSVTGVYRKTRSFILGMQKVVGYLSYFGVLQNDEAFAQIRPGVFLSYVNNDRDLLFADYDTEGNVQTLNAFVFDYQRESFVLYIISTITLILLIIAVLYSFVYLIIALIRLIRRRKTPLNAWRLVLCFSTILTVVNLLIFFSSTQSFSATPTSFLINGLIFILLGLIAVAYAIIVAMKWKLLDLTKKQKAGLIFNGVMGLIATINIIYWQLWMFWI